MTKNKIVLTGEILDELSDIIKNGAELENKGKEIRIRAENVLASFATYGVEIPSKRNKRLLKEMKRTSAWTPLN
ncbi:MAG TPA: hypothetical protein DCS66_17425 [Flavobacteriaceae bacterium]|nr:hypothetical protein [Flavobacteriaceae bacterium]